jgi:hypothetical protein
LPGRLSAQRLDVSAQMAFQGLGADAPGLAIPFAQLRVVNRGADDCQGLLLVCQRQLGQALGLVAVLLLLCWVGHCPPPMLRTIAHRCNAVSRSLCWKAQGASHAVDDLLLIGLQMAQIGQQTSW